MWPVTMTSASTRRRTTLNASVCCLLLSIVTVDSVEVESFDQTSVSLRWLEVLQSSSRRYHTTFRFLDEQQADGENNDNNEQQNDNEDQEQQNEDQEQQNEDQEQQNEDQEQQNEDQDQEQDSDRADNDGQGDEAQQEADNDDNPIEEELADDFFDDRVHDDQYTDDNSVKVVDDFYAYKEDPGPPTLFPLTPRKILGYSIASMAITLGSSGGIGGGGIVVPVYVLVMGLPLKIAIPCGAITVLGGALGSTILNWHRRHPLADRPVIDWDLVLVMEPLTLIGTLCGTLLHRLLSEKFLVVLLVLLLTVTAHTTLTKAMRMYQAEKRYIRHLKAAQAEPPSGSPTSNPLATTWTDEKPLDPRAPFHETESRGQSSKVRSGKEDKQQILIVNPDYVTLRSDLIEQEKFTPRAKIIALICLFSVLLFLNVMVGGGAFKSPWDIRCGSVAFWTVHVCMVAFLIASAWVAQTYVVARHEIKELVRFDYVHGDIIWNAKSAVLYPLIFITAGFFAGTLGIGGGVITVPLMLHFGLHPAVASASSSAMILFTSAMSTTSFLIFGLLLPDFGGLGLLIGFFAALLGQTIMRKARQATSASGRNFERNSYIAFVIGGIILISALLLTVQYVLMMAQGPDNSESSLCDGLRF